jgi:hypothetical protein
VSALPEEDLGIGDDTLDLPTDSQIRAELRERIWDELTPEERATVVRRRRLR